MPTEAEGFPLQDGPGLFPELDRAAAQAAAEENYIDVLADQIGLSLGGRSCSSDLLRLYALLALVKGAAVTLEDVHNAWAVWRAETRPDHPALVPFADLAPDVQALDEPYAEAIRKAAPRAAVALPVPDTDAMPREGIVTVDIPDVAAGSYLGISRADLEHLALAAHGVADPSVLNRCLRLLGLAK